MNKLTVKERIRFVLTQYRCTLADLANGNDSIRVRLSRQINGDAAISLDTIELIIDKFSNVSVEWLIRGIGSMELEGHLAPKIINHDCAIANGANSTASTGHVNGSDDASRIQYLNSVIAMKDDAIRQRDKVIDELRSDKHTLNHQLSCLLIKIKKQ